MDAIGPIGLNYQEICDRIEAEFFKALSHSAKQSDEMSEELDDQATDFIDEAPLDAGQITTAALFTTPSLLR